LNSSLYSERSRYPNRSINTNAHRCNTGGSLPITQENRVDFSGGSGANGGRIAPTPIRAPPGWRPNRPSKDFSTALVNEGVPRRIVTGVATTSALVGSTLEGRFVERHAAPQATGRWLRTGSAIDMATSSTDEPQEPREPTHDQAYLWWSRLSRSANASGRPGTRAP
jgi:hypothetical protein